MSSAKRTNHCLTLVQDACKKISKEQIKRILDIFPRNANPVATMRTLRRIAANLGISHWNFSTNHCGSGGGLECDCSFNNSTLCHATEM
uniref:Uncharacterized protein n=1 Tax=Aegilops tauschii subsp. strangulata TaxID=200361 RepID=A0A453KN27_AEGTS